MTGNLGYTQIAAGQNQKEVTANDDFAIFDGAITEKLAVDLTSADATLTSTQFQQHMLFEAQNNSVSRTLNVPAVKRSLFLVRNTGSAVLSVTRGTTTFVLPPSMFALYATDGTSNGLVCVAQGGCLDIPYTFSGKPKVGQSLVWPMNRKVVIKAGLPGSHFFIGGLPNATATFTITKYTGTGDAGTNVGTLAVHTDGSVVITFTGDVTLAIGNALEISAPSPQDATLSDIGIAIFAILQ